MRNLLPECLRVAIFTTLDTTGLPTGPAPRGDGDACRVAPGPGRGARAYRVRR